MKRTYPVLIRRTGRKYLLVEVPDFEHAMTQGEDLTDAIDMAEDLLGMWCMDYAEKGKPFPVPSELSAVEAMKKSPDDIVTLVNIDAEAYRRAHDSRAVKKNCTIPSWLNAAAEKAGVNFSAVLQEGLKRELNLQSN